MKKLFFIAVSTLLVVSVFTGCMGKKPKKVVLKPIPAWYKTPKQDTADSLYGVGTGMSMEESKNSAIQAVASKIVTQINSSMSMKNEQVDSYLTTHVKQEVNIKTDNIVLPNIKVLNNKLINGEYYAEIQVDRKTVYDIYVSKSTKLLDILSARVNKSLDTNLGYIIKNTKQIGTQISELNSNITVIKGVGYKNENIKTLIAGITKLEKDINERMANVVFFVNENDANGNNRLFLVEMKNVLNKMGYNVINDISKTSQPKKNIVYCDVDTKVLDNQYKQWKTITGETLVSFSILGVEYSNATIKTSSVLGKNRQRSISTLAAQFGQKIEKDLKK